MKAGSEGSTEILNDLLKINNDRIQGYKKAATEIKEVDLKTVFLSLADESHKNASELTREIKKRGGNADTNGTTAAGKIYRAWMDLKATFTGKDKKAVLASCEFGEDAAQKAYREAINSNDLSSDVRQLIRNQQMALRASYDLIKNYKSGSMFFAKLF